ncbi:MAG: hypothetical protein V4506_19255 [Bacteroidota bacterium]
MSDPLPNTVNLILGRKHCGKTPYIVGDTKHNITGIIPSYVIKGMKVLIVDEVYHPSYSHIPVITRDQVANWKVNAGGVYRCVEPDEEGMIELKRIIKKHFWNGAVVFEDAFRHESGQLSKLMRGIVGNNKNFNVDVFFMYHAWPHVPNKLLGYLDYIEMYKTKTEPGPREAKEFADEFEQVLKTDQEVRNNPDPHFHKSVCVTQV